MAERFGLSERRGGGGGHEGSEGQRRWRSAGCVREGQRREEAMGEVEGVPGVSWHSQGDGETGKQGGGGRGACSRAAATRVLSSWREVGDDWQGAVGWAAQ